MSTSTPELANLLREAINNAMASAPRALDDLIRCASNTSQAVAEVTGGTAALDLVPINQGEIANAIYQLQFRKVGSEAPASDLGVFHPTPSGYPVERWFSRKNWDTVPDVPDRTYNNVNELEAAFEWMVSKPESRLVLLVTYFKEQAPSPPGETAKPKKD